MSYEPRKDMVLTPAPGLNFDRPRDDVTIDGHAPETREETKSRMKENKSLRTRKDRARTVSRTTWMGPLQAQKHTIYTTARPGKTKYETKRES
jgi:hypothetical protein